MLTALSLVDQPVSMRVYKHSGDVTPLFLNHYKLKAFEILKNLY